jgi:pilus assembly protein FimV
MNNDKILSATLADIYLQQGHVERAIEIYTKLAKREPENDFFRKRLVAIKKDLKERSKPGSVRNLLKKKLW